MSLAHYLLQVNIYLVIFYCFYKLLLDKETYFVLNRIYLLVAGIFSLTIPFLRFEWFGKQEVAKSLYVGVDQLNNFVTQATVIDDATTKFNWGNFIVFIYLTGVLFFVCRLIFQLFAIRRLFTTIGNGTAFSFLRRKIVSANLPEVATITLHEDTHIKQLHTVDVLFFEVLGIFTWFNPIIYIYKKTIKNIHEYLADEAAAKFQGDKEAYALLLLSQAFGVRTNTLTNGFFTKSLIKKRIFMLHKQRSKKTAILKYGLFVPLFALTLMLSSATIRKNDQILAMAEKIPLNNANQVVTQVIEAPLSVVNFAPPSAPIENEIRQTVELEAPVSTSNHENNATTWNGFYQYLGERIKYPVSAIKKELQGNTIINFSVRRGKINEVNIQNELGEGCDEEVVEQILSYDDYFQKDGNYCLKVTFKLEGVNTPLKNEHATDPEGENPLQSIVITGIVPKDDEIDQNIYSFVTMEKPPTYPGGMQKFYDFLGKTIKYPPTAIENEIQGNVFVSFTVERDGSLSDIKIDRKLGFGTDEEAVRVLKLSRKWNPGVQNGKPVRVKYNIPIKFALDLSKQEKKSDKLTDLRSKISTNNAEAPMVILDNEIKEASTLKRIDPKTVETIQVFDRVNAMIKYGKEAEHGAIIITSKTKKPRVITGTLTNRN